MSKIVLACVLLMIPGVCIAATRDEVAQLEGQRAASTNWIASAESWLRENQDIYYQGTCHAPYQPGALCDTAIKAKERAVVTCGFRWKGCDGVAKLLKGKGDAPVMGYLATVGCNSVAASLRGGTYTEADFAADTIEAVAGNYCEHNDGFLAGVACAYSVIAEIQKKQELEACIESEASQCLADYRRWRSASDKYSTCNSVVSKVQSEQARVRKLDDDIGRLKDGFSYKYLGGRL